MRPTSWLSPEGEVRISYEIKEEAAEEASQLIPLSLEAGGEYQLSKSIPSYS
jgi:hypothetical protein